MRRHSPLFRRRSSSRPEWPVKRCRSDRAVHSALPMSKVGARLLLAAALASLVLAFALLWGFDYSWRLGPFRLRITDPLRPLVVAAILSLAALVPRRSPAVRLCPGRGVRSGSAHRLCANGGRGMGARGRHRVDRGLHDPRDERRAAARAVFTLRMEPSRPALLLPPGTFLRDERLPERRVVGRSAGHQLVGVGDPGVGLRASGSPGLPRHCHFGGVRALRGPDHGDAGEPMEPARPRLSDHGDCRRRRGGRRRTNQVASSTGRVSPASSSRRISGLVRRSSPSAEQRRPPSRCAPTCSARAMRRRGCGRS